MIEAPVTTWIKVGKFESPLVQNFSFFCSTRYFFLILLLAIFNIIFIIIKTLILEKKPYLRIWSQK